MYKSQSFPGWIDADVLGESPRRQSPSIPSAEVPYPAAAYTSAKRLDFSKTPLLEPPTHGELPPLSAKIRPASTWADFFQAQIDNETEIKPVMELKK